jgi:hypothetical protein
MASTVSGGGLLVVGGDGVDGRGGAILACFSSMFGRMPWRVGLVVHDDEANRCYISSNVVDSGASWALDSRYSLTMKQPALEPTIWHLKT